MHRRTRHLVIVALTVLGVALTVAGCGGSSSSPSASTGGAPVKGGTLVATYQGEPQGLDPAIDWEGQGLSLIHI